MTFAGAGETHAPSAEQLFSGAEINAALRRALKGLPEKFRTPLTLRFVEGMSYESIARVIARTPSAARSRVHYGLKALSASLEGNQS